MNFQLDDVLPDINDPQKYVDAFNNELNQGQPTYLNQLHSSLHHIKSHDIYKVKHGILLLEDLYIINMSHIERRDECGFYLSIAYFKIKDYKKAARYFEEVPRGKTGLETVKDAIDLALRKREIGKFSLITGTILTASFILIKLITR